MYNLENSLRAAIEFLLDKSLLDVVGYRPELDLTVFMSRLSAVIEKKPFYLRDYEDYSEIYTLEDFNKYVDSGCYNSDDGVAYFATDKQYSDVSYFVSLYPPVWATHVAWFSK